MPREHGFSFAAKNTSSGAKTVSIHKVHEAWEIFEIILRSLYKPMVEMKMSEYHKVQSQSIYKTTWIAKNKQNNFSSKKSDGWTKGAYK